MSRQRARDVGILAEIIRGTPGPDWLVGTADGQTLAGLRGNDRLESRFTDVTLVGGADNDRMLSAYTLAAAAPAYAATLDGGVGDDRLTFRLETSDGDEFAGAATLRAIGGDGNDRIDVTAAFDSLLAGVAFDVLVLGGAGDDTIRLDLRIDRLGSTPTGPMRLSGGAGDDVVDAFVYGSSEDHARAEFEGDGGGGNDTFRVRLEAVSNMVEASTVANIVGLAGHDVIEVEQSLRGAVAGLASGTLDGGSGDDVIASVVTTDEVYDLDIDLSLVGRGGDDVLSATILANGATGSLVNTELNGGVGDDDLTLVVDRYFGSNWLYGGDGSDRFSITGGGTNRIVLGGHLPPASDTFVDTVVLRPLSATTQRTMIMDFASGMDRFEIVGLEDRGAPGLVDDLDAIATFSPTGPTGMLRVTMGVLTLDIRYAPTNADSFADLVANPATQIFASDDALA